jgi:hypothetical protein
LLPAKEALRQNAMSRAEERQMRFKNYLKIFSVVLMLGLPNLSRALDVNEDPSSFLFKSLAELIQVLPKDKSYSELKRQLWQEYLAYSGRYAKKFFEVAQERQVSLKNYMCATTSPSDSVKKLQGFQSKTATDFSLSEERDQVEVVKLQQLQSDFKEICGVTDPSLALNERAAVVIAETIFYSIYNSSRSQLADLYANL